MKTVSIRSVIGKILRDTKLTDMSYIDDMQNWIPEAMDKMYIQRMVGFCACTVKTDYMGRVGLPDNFKSIGAVVYNGRRVLPYQGAKHISMSKEPIPSTVAYVSTLVKEIVTTTDLREANFWTSQVLKVSIASEHAKVGYTIEPECFWFTEPNAELTMHYYYTPTDEEGFPLIPDDAYAIDAIYWYNRAKIICSGHSDPVFGRDDRICMQRWEENAGRAQRIDYPTIDEEEAKLLLTNRLVFPTNYFNDFNNLTAEEYI